MQTKQVNNKVLGVYRRVDGVEKYIGAPHGDTLIKPGDTIICYGKEDAIINLSRRLKGVKGDLEHVEAIRKERIREEIRRLQGGYD